jgi:RecA-family ATPase
MLEQMLAMLGISPAEVEKVKTFFSEGADHAEKFMKRFEALETRVNEIHAQVIKTAESAPTDSQT